MSVTHNGPMPQTPRSWVKAGLPPGTYDALTDGLCGSRLWSLLLDVAEARAVRRLPAELMEQWDRDRFVQPGIADGLAHCYGLENQRTLSASTPPSN